MIGIIDIDSGNLASLASGLSKINVKYKICRNTLDLIDIRKIIIPGVGAFGDFMDKLKKRNFDIFLQQNKDQFQILGICAGFQILFEESSEHGTQIGLGLIEGKICSFQNDIKNLPVPHVGWNSCNHQIKNEILFNSIDDNSDFYFTHSYYLKECDKRIVLASTDYGLTFPSIVKKENIYGMQFHPEKSQKNGLQILKNFCELC